MLAAACLATGGASKDYGERFDWRQSGANLRVLADKSARRRNVAIGPYSTFIEAIQGDGVNGQ